MGSNLVTLVVTPDGWVVALGRGEVEGAIDLSAIRFCIGRGISLVDMVTLHTCDVAGTRMVILQGHLQACFFSSHNEPLAVLPDSCRPAKDISFVVAGTSAEGFHLVIIRPSHSYGRGGDVLWCDSRWNHDEINLTGIMYEVAPDAVQLSTLSTKWDPESQRIIVRD